MANWVSIKSVAEKYGIPEEQIHEWIRLRYLTCSSIDTEPYEDENPLVDTDELDKALEFNSLKSCPDDAIMVRVRKEHLSWLYQEKARLEKINNCLFEINDYHTQREAELEENFKKLMNYTNEILALHKKMIEDYENMMENHENIMKDCENMMPEKGRFWSSLCHLFVTKKNKALI